MEFSFRTTTQYLFQAWTTETSTGLVLCSVLAGSIGLLLEGLKAAIAQLDQPSKPSWKSLHNLRRSAFAVVQLFLGYVLMLLLMTYNAWVFIALIIGSVLGYFLFGWALGFACVQTEKHLVNLPSTSSASRQLAEKPNGYSQVPTKDVMTTDRETIL